MDFATYAKAFLFFLVLVAMLFGLGLVVEKTEKAMKNIDQHDNETS